MLPNGLTRKASSERGCTGEWMKSMPSSLSATTRPCTVVDLLATTHEGNAKDLNSADALRRSSLVRGKHGGREVRARDSLCASMRI